MTGAAATLAFEKAVAFVFEHEGGFVDDPIDPGGQTNYGIAFETLQRAIFQGLVPSGTTPRTLTKEQARDIYHAFYWLAIRADELPAALAFQLFDAAVNQGPETAVRLLQQALGVEPDGIVGDRTIEAAKLVGYKPRTLDEFIALRLSRYMRTKNVERFGYGWARRSVAVHRRALAHLWEIE